MKWYQVTKTINGRQYLYWQKTYRVGGSVKTLNRYIGPSHNPLRMRSLAAQMADLPEAHKKLRAEYDAGKMTKVEYLEAITGKPRSEATPTFVQAQKVISQEGGYANVSSLLGEN